MIASLTWMTHGEQGQLKCTERCVVDTANAETELGRLMGAFAASEGLHERGELMTQIFLLIGALNWQADQLTRPGDTQVGERYATLALLDLLP